MVGFSKGRPTTGRALHHGSGATPWVGRDTMGGLYNRRMPAITSKLEPKSQEFRDNADYHRALVEELDRRLARAAEGGGQKACDKHEARGKLLVRDRIAALLDPGSPFLEIAPLAAEDMYDGQAPAAGMVCG